MVPPCAPQSSLSARRARSIPCARRTQWSAGPSRWRLPQIRAARFVHRRRQGLVSCTARHGLSNLPVTPLENQEPTQPVDGETCCGSPASFFSAPSLLFLFLRACAQQGRHSCLARSPRSKAPSSTSGACTFIRLVIRSVLLEPACTDLCLPLFPEQQNLCRVLSPFLRLLLCGPRKLDFSPTPGRFPALITQRSVCLHGQRRWRGTGKKGSERGGVCLSASLSVIHTRTHTRTHTHTYSEEQRQTRNGIRKKLLTQLAFPTSPPPSSTHLHKHTAQRCPRSRNDIYFVA